MNHPRILCCPSVSSGLALFSSVGDTSVAESSAISKKDLADTDILIIRSTTRVNQRLLEGTPVRFVGTATAGTDHLDLPYLESNGIHWCAAPGSNANSVAEYIMAALLVLHRRKGLALEGKTLGIVGAGHVGNRVAALAPALGLNVILCDPPLADQAEQFGHVHPFVSLRETMALSDILTLHVPLVTDGPHPTYHLVNKTFLGNMKPDTTLINAARGPIIDSDALRAAYREAHAPARLVLDTWEPEPAFPWDLLERADLATPHIAGYSIDGKVAGTVRVLETLCHFLNRPFPTVRNLMLPQPAIPELTVTRTFPSDLDALSRIVPLVHGIATTDRTFRGLPPNGRVSDDERAKHFRMLRKTYPARREFAGTSIHIPSSDSTLANRLQTLGFRIHAFA